MEMKIEYRFVAKPSSLKSAAAELVALAPNAIVCRATPAIKVRDGHQPQDGQGAWLGNSTDFARLRRRGDRMKEGARQSWPQPVQVRPSPGLQVFVLGDDHYAV
jgi:hypothetical protein